MSGQRGCIVVTGPTGQKVYPGELRDDGEFVADGAPDTFPAEMVGHPLVQLVLGALDEECE